MHILKDPGESMNRLGLEANVIQDIIEVISRFEKVSKVVVFGSRAKGTYKKYSDIDICLFGDVDIFEAQKIKSTIDELNIIYEVDVVSYDTITNALLCEHIDRVGVVVYDRG